VKINGRDPFLAFTKFKSPN